MRRQKDHYVAKRLDSALSILEDGPMKLPPSTAPKTLSQPRVFHRVEELAGEAFTWPFGSFLSFEF